MTTQTPTQTLTDDHVGPSLAMEMVIRGLVAILLIVSMLSVARLFGYDTNQMPWNPLNLRAGSIAVGIDGFFFLFLYMARGFWTKKYWTGKTVLIGFGWFAGAVGLGLFSWFSNALFFSDTIPVTQAQINNAGFGWLTRAQVVQGLGLLTPLIVLWYSFVPRREKRRSLTEIEAELQYREQMQQLQQREFALRAKSADTFLETGMEVAGKALNRIFKLDEKKAQKAAAAAAHQAWKDEQKELAALRARMHLLAVQHGLLTADELEWEDDELERGAETDAWYKEIERRLLAAGVMDWQQQVDAELTEARQAETQTVSAPLATPPQSQTGNSGKQKIAKTHYTAAEAAAFTGIPERTIRARIKTGKIAVAEKKGAHGAALLTHNTVMKLRNNGNSSAHLLALMQQKGVGQNGREPGVQDGTGTADEQPTLHLPRTAAQP